MAIQSIVPQSSTVIRITFTEPIIEPAAIRCIGIYSVVPSAPVVDVRSSLEVFAVEPEDVPTPSYVDVTIEEMLDGQNYDVTIATLSGGEGMDLIIDATDTISLSLSSEETLLVSTYSGAGPVAVSLPEVTSPDEPKVLHVEKSNTSTHQIRITPHASNPFEDGEDLLTLTGIYSKVTLRCSNGKWRVSSPLGTAITS